MKLFAYPVPAENAKFKKYTVHSSHVTNVRWSFDNKYLMSTGGADTAVVVWENTAELSDKAPASASGMCGYGSLESDSDDEENGYDSDVDKETKINYLDAIYVTSIRESKGEQTNALVDIRSCYS